MNYAIIAAGEGARLAAEGMKSPKPLVRVGDECLVDRLIRVFMNHGAKNISVICNDKWPEVTEHLRKKVESVDGQQINLQVVVKSTPSSMHSLYELRNIIGNGPFCLTTVDTVFKERDFTNYIDAFQKHLALDECDAFMGVTEFVDDEKPLYVNVDEQMNIKAFLDDVSHANYVSGGIYGLTTAVWPILENCVLRGERRMRNFQRALIANGLRVKAFNFTKVLDVDHVADVVLANQFIRG